MSDDDSGEGPDRDVVVNMNTKFRCEYCQKGPFRYSYLGKHFYTCEGYLTEREVLNRKKRGVTEISGQDVAALKSIAKVKAAERSEREKENDSRYSKTAKGKAAMKRSQLKKQFMELNPLPKNVDGTGDEQDDNDAVQPPPRWFLFKQEDFWHPWYYDVSLDARDNRAERAFREDELRYARDVVTRWFEVKDAEWAAELNAATALAKRKNRSAIIPEKGIPAAGRQSRIYYKKLMQVFHPDKHDREFGDIAKHFFQRTKEFVELVGAAEHDQRPLVNVFDDEEGCQPYFGTVPDGCQIPIIRKARLRFYNAYEEASREVADVQVNSVEKYHSEMLAYIEDGMASWHNKIRAKTAKKAAKKAANSTPNDDQDTDSGAEEGFGTNFFRM